MDRTMTPAERQRNYRDRKRGAPPPPLVACGHVAAYKRHLRHGETPCDACRAAWAAWHRDRYQRRKN